VFAGFLLGVVTTINASRLLEITGRIDILGPTLSILFVREAAPFFALVIIICASASAITSELSMMRVSGEVELIESQGINIIQFLVLPRSVGLAIAAAGLSLVFATATLVASGVTVALTGRILAAPFMNSIFHSIGLADFVNILGRSSAAAFLAGGICCYEGLVIRGSSTMVPQAVTRAMLGSVGVTLVISATFALITYL
jgi:phospholipid/cholesterol/gamma-HCH transport system permease protein